MITYNPKDWFRLIFRFHSSDTFRILLPTMTMLGALTGGLVFLELHSKLHFKSPTIFHQIIGFVLSMLLVFRINTAYERWWEGRKLWGSLVNNSRSLMSKIQSLLGAKHAGDLALLRDALSTFPYALRDHLRDDARAEDLPAFGSVDRRALLTAQNRPLYLHSFLVRHLQELRSHGVLTDEQLLYLNGELFSLIDITGACERIKNSPIPFSYSLFLKKIIFVYVITMPIAFSFDFSYWAVPAVMIIFYAFASLELISEEVEEPFGTEANDLPTDELADKIRADILTITTPALSRERTSKIPV
jgi:putative membrane protein